MAPKTSAGAEAQSATAPAGRRGASKTATGTVAAGVEGNESRTPTQPPMGVQEVLTAATAVGRMPNVSTATVLKLAFFTIAMLVLPIASYFFSRDYYWKDTAALKRDLFMSAITAVAVVHIVLFGYVVAAYTEDAGDPPVPKKQQ